MKLFMKGIQRKFVTSRFLKFSECFYDTLGVKPDCNQEEIKNAFYSQSVKFHPDKNQNKIAIEAQQSLLKYQAITAAYEVLGNPTKRQQYDISIGKVVKSNTVKTSPEIFKKNMHDPRYRSADFLDPYFSLRRDRMSGQHNYDDTLRKHSQHMRRNIFTTQEHDPRSDYYDSYDYIHSYSKINRRKHEHLVFVIYLLSTVTILVFMITWYIAKASYNRKHNSRQDER